MPPGCLRLFRSLLVLYTREPEGLMNTKEKSPKVRCVECLVFIGRDAHGPWGIFAQMQRKAKSPNVECVEIFIFIRRLRAYVVPHQLHGLLVWIGSRGAFLGANSNHA